jgi:hypothetical protein
MPCVSPLALLSALVERASRDGVAVSDDEWRALLGAGCRAVQIEAALAARTGLAIERSRDAWARVAGGAPPAGPRG